VVKCNTLFPFVHQDVLLRTDRDTEMEYSSLKFHGTAEYCFIDIHITNNKIVTNYTHYLSRNE